jgi:sensor c-di-GMP phosphodiesterase-like protein
MAHGIGLRVVAEGVETKDQYQRLLAIECDQLQGFYFSEPLAASAVPDYLQNHTGMFRNREEVAKESRPVADELSFPQLTQ